MSTHKLVVGIFGLHLGLLAGADAAGVGGVAKEVGVVQVVLAHHVLGEQQVGELGAAVQLQRPHVLVELVEALVLDVGRGLLVQGGAHEDQSGVAGLGGGVLEDGEEGLGEDVVGQDVDLEVVVDAVLAGFVGCNADAGVEDELLWHSVWGSVLVRATDKRGMKAPTMSIWGNSALSCLAEAFVEARSAKLVCWKVTCAVHSFVQLRPITKNFAHKMNLTLLTSPKSFKKSWASLKCSALLATTTILAGLWERRWAVMPSPMPCDPPVTTATLPVRSGMSFL